MFQNFYELAKLFISYVALHLTHEVSFVEKAAEVIYQPYVDFKKLEVRRNVVPTKV